MEYTNEFINNLLEDEIVFSNQLASRYHYPENITHLLYVIIPAFILKYGISHRQLLEQCFFNTPIIIQDKQDQIYQAYYFSIPKQVDSKVTTTKGIVLNNYQNIGLMQLLENLVHEFNHAVNSLQNEIEIKNVISIRTGITRNYFNPKTLHYIKKGEEEILEEVINTRQTEIIIDKIRSFSHYEIMNYTIQNTLYSIYHAVDLNYHSNSYLLESYVCRELIQNKTFLSTLETLRFEGQIEDIHHFFDTIVGKNGSLLKLCQYLKKSLELQKEPIQNKLLKQYRIYKLRKLNLKALKIVQEFNQNTIYK